MKGVAVGWGPSSNVRYTVGDLSSGGILQMSSEEKNFLTHRGVFTQYDAMGQIFMRLLLSTQPLRPSGSVISVCTPASLFISTVVPSGILPKDFPCLLPFISGVLSCIITAFSSSFWRVEEYANIRVSAHKDNKATCSFLGA